MTPRQRAWTLQALHVAVPGRARARLPSAHGGNGLASEIADTLLGCEGIRDVDIRCSTGTVIVHYDPAIPADRLLDAAQSRLFSLARVEVESGTAPAARSRPAPRGRRASMKHQGQPPGSEQASSAGTRPAHWQTLTVAQCLQALGSGPAGLAAAEAHERRIVHGLNEIPEQGPTPAWAMISDQLATAPVAMLAGSAGIALLTGGLVDALWGLEISGAIGQGLGLQFSAPMTVIAEDDDGVTLGADSQFVSEDGGGSGQCTIPAGAPDPYEAPK